MTTTEAHESNQGVRPKLLKGFQDLLPEDMLSRDWAIEKIKRVYERYGFVPLDSPILEYLVTLVGTGGEETNKQLFRLESPEREPIAMRFDLTVPFARLVAQYPDKLKLPFRRYHIGPVFRADDPGPGRFRQFTQFDIDAAGSESVAVDAEIVCAMCDVMKEIGLANRSGESARVHEYHVSINNRKLVDALLESCDIHDLNTHKHVMRVVDKLQKVGVDSVREELGEGRVDASGDPIRGVGLPSDIIDKIISFISVSEKTRRGIIEALEAALPESESSRAAVKEMRELADALDALNVPEEDAVFDPSLARGLDYYTGPVYEAILPNTEVGSVMGGGRYDHLIGRFLNRTIPATGVSIGLDRFMAGLREAGKVPSMIGRIQVLVLSMPSVPAASLLAIASELRAQNVCAVVFFGQTGARVSDQLAYANANSIPCAVVVGEDEIKDNTVSVKDLMVGMQERADVEDREEYRKAGRVGQMTVPRSELVAAVRDVLRRNEAGN